MFAGFPDLPDNLRALPDLGVTDIANFGSSGSRFGSRETRQRRFGSCCTIVDDETLRLPTEA